MIEKVNVTEKFGLFNDHWHPRMVGEFNGLEVRLAKIKGQFTWHQHEKEDEMFLVFKGVMRMELRQHTILVHEGEFIIIPRGTDHRPAAETEEAWLMVFDPASTINTGNVVNEYTHNETPPI